MAKGRKSARKAAKVEGYNTLSALEAERVRAAAEALKIGSTDAEAKSAD